MKNILMLIKKETLSLKTNGRYMLFAGILLGTSIFGASIEGRYITVGILILLATVTTSQLVYDSFVSDIKDKSILFYINCGCNYGQIAASKTAFSSIIGIAIVSSGWNWIMGKYEARDFLWIISLMLANCMLSISLAILIGNKSSMGEMISLFASFGLSYSILELPHLCWKRFSFAFAELIALYIVSSRLYKARMFRRCL